MRFDPENCPLLFCRRGDHLILMKQERQSPIRSTANAHNEQSAADTNTRLNPWDAAKKFRVLRSAPGYPMKDLEPGVKFFVLMLEQLGATTHYSCEGHPQGFYITFSCPYETALRIRECGYFRVEIVRPDTWAIRVRDCPRIKSPQEKARLLRWAATS